MEPHPYSTDSNIRKLHRIRKIYNLFRYYKTVWTCLYIKQLYSRYLYIATARKSACFYRGTVDNNVQNRSQNVCLHVHKTVKQKVILRLFSVFKGAYPCLLPEANFKISHANRISNTSFTVFSILCIKGFIEIN